MSANSITITIMLLIVGGCVFNEYRSRVEKNRADEQIIRKAEELKQTAHLYQGETVSPQTGNYNKNF